MRRHSLEMTYQPWMECIYTILNRKRVHKTSTRTWIFNSQRLEHAVCRPKVIRVRFASLPNWNCSMWQSQRVEENSTVSAPRCEWEMSAERCGAWAWELFVRTRSVRRAESRTWCYVGDLWVVIATTNRDGTESQSVVVSLIRWGKWEHGNGQKTRATIGRHCLCRQNRETIRYEKLPRYETFLIETLLRSHCAVKLNALHGLKFVFRMTNASTLGTLAKCSQTNRRTETHICILAQILHIINMRIIVGPVWILWTALQCTWPS